MSFAYTIYPHLFIESSDFENIKDISESCVVNQDVPEILNKFLKDYDFYEKYDQSKTYNYKEFDHDYGKGLKKYVYVLYGFSLHEHVKSSSIFKFIYNFINEPVLRIIKLQYVVIKEIPTNDELKELEPYCRCLYCTHKMNILNPLTWIFPCRTCCGCIRSSIGIVNTSILKKSREYRRQVNLM